MGCALQQLGANGCGGKLLQYRRAVGLTPRPAGNFLQSWTLRGRGFFLRASSRLHHPEDSQLPGDSQLTSSG